MPQRPDESWAEYEARLSANADPATAEALEHRRQQRANAPEPGSDLLDEVERYLAQFVVFPSEHARVAHTLWVAHTHAMDKWESTPRLFFASPEPGSGKSRALEVTEPLVPRPVHAVNVTPAYLFRKVSDEAGAPTILYDEIDTIFGPKAKENEDLRGVLNAGHRKGAFAGRCVVKGRAIETEELPAYCAVAMAGLADLPDTLMSRSVVIRMRRRRADEPVTPWRHRIHAPMGEALRDRLAKWASTIPAGVWPEIPESIADRDADVWEPLLMVADHAGGRWPERARVSAVTLVTDSQGDGETLGIRLLRDIRSVFGDREHLPTDALIEALVAVEEAPWGDLRGKALDARGLAKRLLKYGIRPRTVRFGERTAKGYSKADFADAWVRYLPSGGYDYNAYENMTNSVNNNTGEPSVSLFPQGSVTSVTSVTSQVDGDGWPDEWYTNELEGAPLDEPF